MILRKKIYCKKYQERVERLSQQNRVIKFRTDANSWQRLTSESIPREKTLKNSRNLQSQWLVVSSLCREMKNHLTRKVGFEGTPKLDQYWKPQPATYKVNVEWKFRTESRNKDNSHSWNKLVTDLSNNKENDNNEQETSEMQFEDFALKEPFKG